LHESQQKVEKLSHEVDYLKVEQRLQRQDFEAECGLSLDWKYQLDKKVERLEAEFRKNKNTPISEQNGMDAKKSIFPIWIYSSFNNISAFCQLLFLHGFPVCHNSSKLDNSRLWP
jgi:hypothetical protein